MLIIIENKISSFRADEDPDRENMAGEFEATDSQNKGNILGFIQMCLNLLDSSPDILQSCKSCI